MSVSAACLTGAVGAALLAVGSAAAYPMLAAGLLLAVAGAVVRRPRGADRLVAAVLLVVLAPLLLVVGVLVRLTSPGPALVRRSDAWGQPTSTLRFRTTVGGGGWPVTGDALTATSIGGLLHRSGLDELPALLDVVRGELSLFRSARR